MHLPPAVAYYSQLLTGVISSAGCIWTTRTLCFEKWAPALRKPEGESAVRNNHQEDQGDFLPRRFFAVVRSIGQSLSPLTAGGVHSNHLAESATGHRHSPRCAICVLRNVLRPVLSQPKLCDQRTSATVAAVSKGNQPTFDRRLLVWRCGDARSGHLRLTGKLLERSLPTFANRQGFH